MNEQLRAFFIKMKTNEILKVNKELSKGKKTNGIFESVARSFPKKENLKSIMNNLQIKAENIL